MKYYSHINSSNQSVKIANIKILKSVIRIAIPFRYIKSNFVLNIVKRFHPIIEKIIQRNTFPLL